MFCLDLCRCYWFAREGRWWDAAMARKYWVHVKYMARLFPQWGFRHGIIMMFSKPNALDQLMNMGCKHTYVLIITIITACLFIITTDQCIEIIKGNRLDTGRRFGRTPLSPCCRLNIFLHHYLNIWGYAALLNSEHQLCDFSSGWDCLRLSHNYCLQRHNAHGGNKRVN